VGLNVYLLLTRALSSVQRLFVISSCAETNRSAAAEDGDSHTRRQRRK
jgi:hypothetical protein